MTAQASFMDRSRLRELMYDLAVRPGHHLLPCTDTQDATRLRNRMNKIRAVERSATVKANGNNAFADDSTVLDRLVLIIQPGGKTLEVVSSEPFDIGSIQTLQPDGTKVQTFPPAPNTPDSDPAPATIDDEGDLL